LADRLAYLFQEPEQRRQMGLQAIQRVQQHFTWRRVADLLSAVYEEVLQQSELNRCGRTGKEKPTRPLTKLLLPHPVKPEPAKKERIVKDSNSKKKNGEVNTHDNYRWENNSGHRRSAGVG
jgi:hypothetical protein